MIKENQKYINRIAVFLDASAIIFSLLLSWYIRFESGLLYAVDAEYIQFTEYLKPIVFVTPVYLILYSALKLYTPYRFKTIYEEAINILKANAMGILIFIMFLYIFKEINYSRYLLLIFAILSTTTTIIERATVRFVLHRVRKRGYNLKHILVIGYNSLTIEFLNRLERNKHWDYNLVAILDEESLDEESLDKESLDKESLDKESLDKESIDKESIEKNKVWDKRLIHSLGGVQQAACEIAASRSQGEITIGTLDELEHYLTHFGIDEVFVTLGIKQYDLLGGIIELCEKSGIRTQIIPDYYKYIPARPYVEELDGLPVINIRYVPLDNLINKTIKRVFDSSVAFIALLFFLPIMMCIALFIKVTSPGPIFFKQERVGLDRKPFFMYKFRSMKIQDSGEEIMGWTKKNDPRKTKLGNFIRKTSIDELPQLFNVLKGDMSLVGPRPERPHFVRQFKEEIPKYMIKHQVRPGITGWAQVNGWRGDTSIVKRIECDVYYIENWNFWFDIRILWLTVFKGFVNKNAY